jgi:hypothetical protein
MDKIFSARIDEEILRELEIATERLGITKKSFLEQAIRLAAKNLNELPDNKVWEMAFGCWQREGSAAEDVANVKRAFRAAASRHHRGSRANVRG